MRTVIPAESLEGPRLRPVLVGMDAATAVLKPRFIPNILGNNAFRFNSPVRPARIPGVAADGVQPSETLSGKLARLAEAFARGRREAFDEIVHTMRDRLYALALRSLRDPGIAEDLVQETFVKAYRSLPALKDAATCERWLYQVTMNLVRDVGRRRSLERRTLETLGHEAPDEHHDTPTALDADSALGRRILEAVDTLPAHHRDVFVMREIQGLSHARIAADLGVPEGTVWSRLSFARRALQQKLRKEIQS